jgi:hypothetical protein
LRGLLDVGAGGFVWEWEEDGEGDGGWRRVEGRDDLKEFMEGEEEEEVRVETEWDEDD